MIVTLTASPGECIFNGISLVPECNLMYKYLEEADYTGCFIELSGTIYRLVYSDTFLNDQQYSDFTSFREAYYTLANLTDPDVDFTEPT